ncbi:hypothetical protein O181_031302 [Austropuccinia psidii MF-1]|uniref:Uncharacterized protein n=1 Tax=Austropuccinia psidii MF-1 TaxID=1389203 RepID=A0A9Q3CXD0_9BASI|nr:hypothetical protein [Austropuccinia psidii MF-1]
MSPLHLRNLESQGTSQTTEKACLEPKDLEEDTLDPVVDFKKLREIISTMPFTLQFNRNLKPEDWKNVDQVLQLHQLLKHLFQWRMDKETFNLASYWAELQASFQRYFSERYPSKTLWKSPKVGTPPSISDSWRRGQPG